MKIALKLWLWMTALVLTIIALSLIYQTFELKDAYMDQRMREIKQMALEAVRNGDISYLHTLESRFNASFYIVYGKGNFIYSSESVVFPPLVQEQLPYFEQEGGEYLETTVMHPSQQVSWTLIGMPVNMQGNRTFYLFIILSIEDVEGMMSLLTSQYMHLALILVAIASVLALAIANSFTRPILQIEKTTLRMAQGDFDIRIDKPKKDEIGRLAVAINALGEALNRMERLRRELISNISHELRTPLALIRGYAETVRDITGDDPVVRNAQLETVIEETKRLSGIVNTIMDYSQIQSGFLKLETERLDFSALASSVADVYSLELDSLSIKLSRTLQTDLYVNGDPDKLKQILHNLIGNAINHTPTGGLITLKTFLYDGKARLTISDTGSGIAPDDLPHIFKRFYKSPVQIGRRRKGTGLGMSVALSLAQAHGGTLTAANIEGGGALFTLTLPLA